MVAKIPLSYYQSDDVVFLARDLLGKILMTQIDGQRTGGMISETEAYAGITDRASHAFGGRRTTRTETMYMNGGTSYVYLCYGVHHLFNIVTGAVDVPHAVLIRAVYPVVGWETICNRRNKLERSHNISDGPGKLTQALGIDRTHDGLSLDGDVIWLEDDGLKIEDTDIRASRRIGVDYAGPDAMLPYRFNLRHEKYI